MMAWQAVNKQKPFHSLFSLSTISTQNEQKNHISINTTNKTLITILKSLSPSLSLLCLSQLRVRSEECMGTFRRWQASTTIHCTFRMTLIFGDPT